MDKEFRHLSGIQRDREPLTDCMEEAVILR